jgi:hypothetical protein
MHLREAFQRQVIPGNVPRARQRAGPRDHGAGRHHQRDGADLRNLISRGLTREPGTWVLA